MTTQLVVFWVVVFFFAMLFFADGLKAFLKILVFLAMSVIFLLFGCFALGVFSMEAHLETRLEEQLEEKAVPPPVEQPPTIVLEEDAKATFVNVNVSPSSVYEEKKENKITAKPKNNIDLRSTTGSDYIENLRNLE